MRSNLDTLTLRIFSRILGEAPEKKPKKEAPDDAPLGNYAFAEFRRDLPFGIERDTDEEVHLEDNLIQHFDGDRQMSSKSVELMQTIISNGWYKNILRRPKQSEVYRGIRMDKAWLAANVGKDWEKKFKKGKGFIEVDLKLPPPNGEPVASWTTDISIAKDFSAPNNRTDKIGIIFYARVKDKDNLDKFIDGHALYAIPDFSTWKEEAEVIGIGPISVYKIELNTTPTRRY